MFGLTVPPAAVLLALVVAVVPPDAPQRPAGGRIDVVGAVTATAGLLGLVLALTTSARAGWGAPATLLPLAAGIALLGAFLLVQSRVRAPLLPPALWRLPNLAPVLAIGSCLFAAWVGANFFLSLALQRVLGYTATGTAVALLPLAAGGLVFATLAGSLLPRVGARRLLVGGLAGYVAGFALMATLDTGSTYWAHVFPAIVLAVAGNSIAYVATTVVALAHAPPDRQSVVGALFNTGMQIGGGLGLAVMNTVAAADLTVGTGEALLRGYQAAFWTAAVLAGLGLLIAALLVRPATPATV